MNISSQETQSEGRKVDKRIKVNVTGALTGLCAENYGNTEEGVWTSSRRR